MKSRIIVTRPLPQALSFARALQRRGFSTLLHPALVLSHPPLKPNDLNLLLNASSILLTSPSAARALSHHNLVERLLARKTFIVAAGNATARTAKRLSLQPSSCNEGAHALIQHILQNPPPQPIVHARGLHVAAHVSRILQQHQLNAHDVVLHHARRVSSTPPHVRRALQQRSCFAVAFFSPRSALAFLHALPHNSVPLLKHLHAVSISQKTADALQQIPFASQQVAQLPTQNSLINAIPTPPIRASLLLSSPHGGQYRYSKKRPRR